jgi:eukaryotic-like serine/threonine-protein kinase
MPLAPGARLDRYEILAPLGRGAMGEVYRALDARLGRDVAIKVLPAAFSADAERLRRFDQEARSAGALNHPNILAIFDVGSDASGPFVVSELLQGASLRERLAGGPLPLRKAIEYGAQIARGLAAAHAKGIIHRDLKPENLFITSEGVAKILDFGLAKLVRPDQSPLGDADSLGPTMTREGAILGTVGYMAPEQVQGQATDQRSDIFALGCVLFEMVTGERAFVGTTPVETMYAILKNDLPAFPAAVRSASPGLMPIIRRSVEKLPGERFESARDLAFALEMLVEAAGDDAKAGAAEALRMNGNAALSPDITYRRVSFRRGGILSARFTPDGHSVVYSGAWEGQPPELFSARIGNPESGTLGHRDADLFGISPSGEMAVMLRLKFVSSFDRKGTLARIPPLGGAARELLHDVHAADWTPDGAQLAVVRDKDGMVRLELPIGRVLYETAGWISDMRVSRAGDQIAFIDHPSRTSDDGAILLTDREGNRRCLSAGWGTVRGLSWSADGREVWFAADRGGAARGLYAVNLEGGVRRVIQVASNLSIHDVASDGRALVSHGSERAGISGQAPGDTRERDLSWLDWSLLHDLSEDGRMMLISESSEGGGESGSVYIRPTDGSAAVRLGDGQCFCYSPDGEWVLARQSVTSTALVVLPTGVGEPRNVPSTGLRTHSAKWLAAGHEVVVAASEEGHGTRLYRLDITSGARTPLSPEGMDPTEIHVHPGGEGVAGFSSQHGYQLFALSGGEPRSLSHLTKEERIVRWDREGRSVYAWKLNEIPARVFRIDLENGERTLWRELTPPDPTGIYRIGRLHISAAADAYAYTYYMHLLDLNVIDGLK